ncbi:hypothetical protein IKF32_03220 [Candidatus Saccharibacteria bacterium]|nr:hypothetical protein [Candidatus Saccharibacteria bacterium]
MKKKQTSAINSRKLHVAGPRKSYFDTSPLSKKIVLTVILLLMIVIVVATLFAFLFKNEYVVKAKLDYLAHDYYENYLYDSFKNSAPNSDVEQILNKNTVRGLSRITLRQLLLHDESKNADIANYLLEYCDENKTYVIIYPEPPYEKTSYHLKYTYSCNF